MAKDITTEEEWDFGEESRPELTPREQRPVRSGGSGGGSSSMKDYLIVALIAIIAVMGINNFIYARSGPSGGFAGGGGCCGSGGGAVAGLSNAELEVLGLQYYFANTGDEDVDSVTAQVQDFGCHQEIYIYKDGQQVMRVGYGNGQVYEI